MTGLDLIPWRFRSRHNFVKAHANFFFRHVLKTRPVPASPESDVVLHVLVCKRDLNMCIVAIKSFLRFAPAVAVMIHDDGTVDDRGRQRLAHHVPGSRFIPRQEADRELAAVLPPDMMDARRRHVLMMKVFDFNHFGAGRRTLVFDSDLVFRAAPQEAIRWIERQDERDFYNPDPLLDTYRAPVRPKAPLAPNFNSGFLGYNHRIGQDEIVAAVRTIDYALEDQTVYAYLLAGRPCVALDPVRYLIYQGGAIPDEAAMVHFISPDRFTDMTYVKLAREVCGSLQ